MRPKFRLAGIGNMSAAVNTCQSQQLWPHEDGRTDLMYAPLHIEQMLHIFASSLLSWTTVAYKKSVCRFWEA